MTSAVHVVTDPGVPAFGSKGCSVHVQEVLRELGRRFDRVHLVTTRPGGTPLPRVVVHALERPSGPDVAAREAAQRTADAAAARVLASICGSEPVALVYQRYSLWSAAVAETARALGIPVVLEINAPLPVEQARHRGLHDAEAAVRYTRRVLRAASAPFAVARPVARWAEGLDPLRRAIPVIGNGVDTTRFSPARRPSEPVVVFAGTFKAWHGLDLMVDATALARDQAPLRLLLVGDGPERAGTVARARAARVPVESTGALIPSDVPAALRRAAIAVAGYPAGEHYFSPLKVAEYLATGLPTVASAIADLPDLVADGTEALLVPPGDVVATADALARVATDPALADRLAQAGRSAAVARMSWSAVVDRTLGLVREPAGGGPPCGWT